MRLIFLLSVSCLWNSLLISKSTQQPLIVLIDAFCWQCNGNSNLQSSVVRRRNHHYRVSLIQRRALPSPQILQDLYATEDAASYVNSSRKLWNTSYPETIDNKSAQVAADIKNINNIVASASASATTAITTTRRGGNADLWFQRYHLLEKFQKQNGHCRVPQKYEVDPSLGLWVGYQRKCRDRGRLSEERERLLNELGFEWNLKKDRNSRVWAQRLEALRKFKLQHGHCRIPAIYEADPSLGTWVQNQRQFKKHGHLSKDRERLLNELGFEWNILQMKPWIEHYYALQKFKLQNGHFRIPPNYCYDDSSNNLSSLGAWVYHQRQLQRKGYLSEEREKMLNELGFEWTVTKTAGTMTTLWMQRYQEVQKFKEENGHCRIPKNYKVNTSLGLWVSTQRQMKKKGCMSEERERLLNNLGFEWDINSNKKQKDDILWLQRFRKLEIFQQEHGHCSVPTKYDKNPILGTWVQNQRQFQKKGSLSEDRENMLNRLGFQWTNSWEQNFDALKRFQQENGHCHISAKHDPVDPTLKTWVSNQRRCKKKGRLSKEREDMLNELGFEWSIVMANKRSWSEQFQELKKFKQVYGHCRIPKKYEADPSLGAWVQNQRQLKKKGRLSEIREYMLNELGFEWSIHAKNMNITSS